MMKIRRFVLAALLLLGLAVPSAAQQTQRQWFEGDPIPLRYDLALTPDVEAGTFTGDVRIRIRSSEALPTVTMNALDLTITRATIDNVQAAVSTDEEAQTLTLTPRRPLRAGEHTIRVQYSGPIIDDPYGLFRVQYADDDGTMRRAITTQFEPGDARRMLPLWDQPNRRAVFAVTLTHPSDQMAIGNMPAARAQRLAGGLTRTTFQDSPSMPSYLLFIAVGDFERVTRDVNGVELGVVVRRGQTARAQYALQAGEESLRYFTDYFGIPYPLPKLDMVAVPGAGGFAAMENWGAILYFDQYLLLDDDRSSEGERQFVWSTVAHEIAHQWFGNLVTMTWWDDLWLNEGFASWMAAKAVEHVHPEWQPWLAQLTDGTSTAMALDAREGSHPIVQTINTLEEANLAFDSITYEKGLAVIRMLEGYVGEESFRNGVRAYLNSRLYGNARTEDLWTAVQAASGQPVLEIARSFTTQMGYPLITAAGADCRREPNNGVVSLTQRRFALDEASRTGELWAVPIVARRVGGEPVRTVLPQQGAGSVDVGACGAYLINAGQSGFFRTIYDAANFERLRAGFASLDDADQLGLLLDYWAFGRSGDAPFTSYLELAEQAPADADPLVVGDTVGSYAALAAYAKGRPSEAAVRAFARERVAARFARVGWDQRPGETSNDILLRAALIGTLAGLDDEAVIAEARRRATANDPALLPAGIRNTVLGIVASHATAAEYDALVARARAATDFVEQRRLWRQVASVKDETLARRTLQLTLGEDIPRQLRAGIVVNVAGEHTQMAWDFLVANRAAIEALLDPLSRLEYPTGVAGQSTDPAMADALIAYARDFPPGAQPQIASAASSIRSRALTIQRSMPVVEQWIAQRRAPPPRRR